MRTSDNLQYDFFTSNEDKLREKLQNEINSAFNTEQYLYAQELSTRQKITKCRQKLRALENSSTFRDVCLFEATPLTDFFMNICYACDLALAGTGKRVIFSGSADCAFICREAVMRQVLNMISNAALYSESPIISTELKSFNHHAFFTVCNSGKLSLPKAQRAFSNIGSGLWYITQTAQLHGSAALISLSNNIVRVSVGINTSAVKSQKPVRDFTSLLCDRLSPVYTHLSTIEGL